MSQSLIDTYASDMKTGRWIFTGEPIILDEDGGVLDGQHRLAAVTQAGVSVTFLVVSGIDSEAMNHINTGKRRSMGDIFTIVRGTKSANAVASALTSIFVIQNHGERRNRIPPEEYFDLYDVFAKDLHWAIDTIGGKIQAGGPSLSSGCGPVWGAFAFCRGISPKRVEEMANRFKTNSGATKRDNSTALRRVVYDFMNRGSQEVRHDLLVAALVCIEAEILGRKVTPNKLEAGKQVFDRILKLKR